MRPIGRLLGVGLTFAVVSVLAESLPRECSRAGRSSVDESFDNTTVRRRTVAPSYSASAEAKACSLCLLDVYVFMGASVTGVNVDMLLRNVHRKGRLRGDIGPLEEVMARHCRHNPAVPPDGQRRNR